MAPLNFNPKVIPEPALEFGDGGRHVDPRFGLVGIDGKSQKLANLYPHGWGVTKQ